MACPILVGTTDRFLGRAGPHILPDHSEVLFGGYNSGPSVAVHRFAYPALGAPIESFNLDHAAISMCVGGDGNLYYSTQGGEFYRRTDPTGTGSDDLMIDLGLADGWTLAWSAQTQTIFAIRHDDGFVPQVWEVDPADDSGTLMAFGFVAVSSPTPFFATATPGSIWFVHGVSLYRYDIASTEIDTTVITTATNEVAATNDGRAIFMSVYDTVSEVSTVDDDMTPTVWDCPLLVGGVEFGFAELNGGTMDPSGSAFAVFSMYTGNDPAGDDIWSWPAGWTVGRVSWGTTGSWH